jgi:membrane AbrB-like protein
MHFQFSQSSARIRWMVLLSLSIAFSVLLSLGHFPAAVLLGCMFAAIFISIQSSPLVVPKWSFTLAQGVVGCLMARSLKPEVLERLASNWTIFLGISLCILAASVVLGWFFMRRGIFPGTTALWGLTPGASAAMVIMSESYGADPRLVAFMQYLRVAMVTAIAAIIVHFCSPSGVAQANASTQWLAIHPFNLAMTVLLILGTSIAAYKLTIPAGALILPLVLAAFLQYFGWLVIELPLVLLTAAYAILGWSIGLRFSKAILKHALHFLPQVLLAISALIILSGVIAIGLSGLADYDLLTAYLASSPGGADSLAIIAATTTADAGFVMAMQVSRFLFVLMFGPIVSKWIATRNNYNH